MKTLYIIDTLKKVGEEVELLGWVDTKRDHKKIVFIDLRDRTGKIQIVGGEDFKTLSTEDVVKITGLIKQRPEKMVNPNPMVGGEPAGRGEPCPYNGKPHPKRQFNFICYS